MAGSLTKTGTVLVQRERTSQMAKPSIVQSKTLDTMQMMMGL